MEQGSAEAIFARPASDYTRTLIDSIPLADPHYQQNKRRQRQPALFSAAPRTPVAI